MKPRSRSDRGERGDRGGERGRGRDRERGGRGRRGGRERDGERDGGRRPDRGSRDDEPRASERSEPKPTGPSEAEVLGELSEHGDYVRGMVEKMQLGSFQIREAEDGDFVVIELKGEAAEGLAHGDSRAVGAIQLLVNQAAMRADEAPKRIVIDCAGATDQRDSFLERQAGRAAKRALETGRSVALDPMNARDRRALHVAVREIDDVVTMSVGTGRYRQVVIVPKGADEYDEALKAAEEAQSRD